MNYDFDKLIDRNGTNSYKWDFVRRDGKIIPWDETDSSIHDRPVLPLWVADMDFLCAQPIIDAVNEIAKTGIYGYSVPPPSYYDAVVGWMHRRHNWIIKKNTICIAPGVVPALHLIVSAYTNPGDRVLIQTPVYYPFYDIAEQTGTQVTFNPLCYTNNQYQMNFDDLSQKCADPSVKLAILCSPHNPVGRVWSREELKTFGRICIDNNVLVVSDEIHGDLILGENKFVPYATLGPEYEDLSIICTSPSKTFNLAGLQASNIIIHNSKLRKKFQSALRSVGIFTLNSFGIASVEAACNYGEEWLDQLVSYLNDNLRFLINFFHERLPEVSVTKTEGSYLVWVDFRGLGLDKEALEKIIMDDARVYLNQGYIFGSEGEGFERINIACPRSILTEALERIETSVKAYLKQNPNT